tara:strand:+ start:32 stop:286 length:255 start_codon:yes stop_codon:yes gene_type:complete
MIDLNDKKIVDLTVELIARVTRLDGTIEEGTTDHYGHGWPSEETINEQDGTMERKLRSVESLPGDKATELLGLDDPDLDEDEEG